MKRLIITLSILLSLKSFAGNAIIPFWSNSSVWSSCFNISNITNSDVIFTVNLYNHDGEIYDNNIIWNTNIEKLSNETYLKGNTSALFCLDRQNNTYYDHYSGFGEIITKDVNNERAKGLVIATGFHYRFPTDTRSTAITINNNLPF